jgi:hypothetical protein
MADKPTLPPLFAPMARSFWAQALLLISVALNTAGIDLFRMLGEMGLGRSPEEVLATSDRVVSAWQQLAPLVFGLWAWLERRAPNYRLVFWRKRDGKDAIAAGSSALALVLAILLMLPAGRVQAAQCAGLADVLAGLSVCWSEQVLWQGGAEGGVSFSITVNPDGTTWTALMLRPDGLACVVASGSGWTAGAAPKAPGEAG